MDDIARQSGARNLDDTMNYIKKSWESASPTPGGRSGQMF